MDAAEFDVADAFKKPDRSAGLAGRLATRRPQRPTQHAEAREAPPQSQEPTESPETAPQGSEPTPTVAEPQEATAAPQKTRRRPSPRKAGQGSDGRLVVSLPVALRDRARAHAGSRGETYLDVALAAVQETHSRLPQLLAARHGHDEDSTATAAGSLFEHRPRPRKTPEATAQVTIRGLSVHDRAVLEQLVDDVGAANLTELLTVALDEHLPQRPRALR